MRDFDDNVWVRYVAEKVQDSSESIVIDDIRRKNEINFLRPYGFTFIRINTDERLRKSRIEEREGKKITKDQWMGWVQHMTENQVSSLPVDYEIENNGSIEELYSRMESIIIEMLGKRE